MESTRKRLAVVTTTFAASVMVGYFVVGPVARNAVSGSKVTIHSKAFAFAAPSLRSPTVAGAAVAMDSRRGGDVKMFGLFGNTEESQKKRADLSLRAAPAGSRVVTFRKPNAATTGLLLGLKFKEGWGGSVFIDKVIPGTQAERLKQQGELTEGDEVVMASATFGDEMWSSRGVGKERLESSIKVRQGMFVSLVLEGRNSADRDRAKKLAAEQEKTKRLQNRLQKELQDEVDAGAKGKKTGPFGLW